MDMPDQGRALKEVHRVLRPGGFLQFSILHPCFVPPYRKVLREDDGKVRAIEIGGYFDGVDGAIESWWFSTLSPREKARVAPFKIPRFHRTLSQWVEMIVSSGLVIEKFDEPFAGPEQAEAEPVVADSRAAPLFLLMRVTKPQISGVAQR
jgi:SAM-dependent methyltransferase